MQYIVLGDNNYWYTTFDAETKSEAKKQFREIKKDILSGEVFDISNVDYQPNKIYLYGVKEIAELEI